MVRMLTAENTTFELDEIPDEVDDVRYCVLDYSSQDVDYYFFPLMFLENFTSPAVDLRIGQHRVQMPLDWSVVIGEKDLGDIEIVSLESLNDRDFHAFCFNPLSSYVPDFLEIEIVHIFPDIKWYFPTLKNGHILAVPLDISDKPQIAYFVRDTNKIPDALDIRKLF